MYRNPHFGLVADPCTRSACKVCLLGHRPNAFATGPGNHLKAKARMSTDIRTKRSSGAMKKRQNVFDVAVRRALERLEYNFNLMSQRKSSGMCICTLHSGQLYKILMVPSGLGSISFIADISRERMLRGRQDGPCLPPPRNAMRRAAADFHRKLMLPSTKRRNRNKRHSLHMGRKRHF
ncbi:uncharacterized protein LOC115633925 isoform X2 [Scaptodrosophila lebanonensis]|nr:uncharacterized protein LOC115633925 isoform X2 [Scaptodrosophila lebanonensis]